MPCAIPMLCGAPGCGAGELAVEWAEGDGGARLLPPLVVSALMKLAISSSPRFSAKATCHIRAKASCAPE